MAIKKKITWLLNSRISFQPTTVPFPSPLLGTTPHFFLLPFAVLIFWFQGKFSNVIMQKKQIRPVKAKAFSGYLMCLSVINSSFFHPSSLLIPVSSFQCDLLLLFVHSCSRIPTIYHFPYVVHPAHNFLQIPHSHHNILTLENTQWFPLMAESKLNSWKPFSPFFRTSKIWILHT